jgi:hypothetical protein
MRTKKEDLDKYMVRSFVGSLLETNFITFDGSSVQELIIKRGRERIRVIYPFVKPNTFPKKVEQRWNVIEKETNLTSYEIFNPNSPGATQKEIKEFWNAATKVQLQVSHKTGVPIDVDFSRIIPYVKTSKRVKYYELVGETLSVSFKK